MDKNRLLGVFYNWSIQLKLVLIISVIIIVSLTGIIYIATHYFKKDNEVRIKEKNLEITELLAAKTRSDLSIMARSAVEVAKGTAGGGLSDLRTRSGFQNPGEIFQGEEFVVLHIYRMDGNTPVLAFKNYNSLALFEKGWERKKLDSLIAQNLNAYGKANQGSTVVRNASMDSEPLMGLSHPFRIDGGKGFLVVVSAMETIQSSFKSSGISDNFMVTSDGAIVAHSRIGRITTYSSIKDESLYQKIVESPINNGQLKYSDKDGDVYIASFKKLGLADLTVVTTVPEEKAMEEVNNIQRRNFYLMVVILNLSILVVLVYSKKMTRPILKLVDASKQIEKGDFHVEIQETSGDEIGVLTRSFVKMGKGLSERDKIKDAFGKFVNAELAEKVIHGEIQLGGSRKECTIFFSDIRNFTSMSEEMEPEEVVEFLNQYMTKMVACVNATDGIVDKFIGDSIMAVWGAISSTGKDTENALESALMMREALVEFNQARRGSGKPDIQIGIGINTGPVISGQIGSEERLEFTVIGDAVNLASRIESLNKSFGTDILISESAYEHVRDLYECKKMQSIQVKGKKKPQVIYAVLGRKNGKQQPLSREDRNEKTSSAQKKAPAQAVAKEKKAYHTIPKKRAKIHAKLPAKKPGNR